MLMITLQKNFFSIVNLVFLTVSSIVPVYQRAILDFIYLVRISAIQLPSILASLISNYTIDASIIIHMLGDTNNINYTQVLRHTRTYTVKGVHKMTVV